MTEVNDTTTPKPAPDITWWRVTHTWYVQAPLADQAVTQTSGVDPYRIEVEHYADVVGGEISYTTEPDLHQYP
jgi:hypothetical protein